MDCGNRQLGYVAAGSKAVKFQTSSTEKDESGIVEQALLCTWRPDVVTEANAGRIMLMNVIAGSERVLLAGTFVNPAPTLLRYEPLRRSHSECEACVNKKFIAVRSQFVSLHIPLRRKWL